MARTSYIQCNDDIRLVLKDKSWIDLHQIWNIYIFSGNEKLHTMTEHDPYILRVELEDFENRTRHADVLDLPFVFTVNVYLNTHRQYPKPLINCRRVNVI
jgi:hypothetical protein